MNRVDLKKEHDTLKRKFAIPKGEKLKEMLKTEEGRKRYELRSKKWKAFMEKWNIVFMLGDKPVFKKKKNRK